MSIALLVLLTLASVAPFVVIIAACWWTSATKAASWPVCMLGAGGFGAGLVALFAISDGISAVEALATIAMTIAITALFRLTAPMVAALLRH